MTIEKKLVFVGIHENGLIEMKMQTTITENGETHILKPHRDTFMPGFDTVEKKETQYPGCDMTLLQGACDKFHTDEIKTAYVAANTE